MSLVIKFIQHFSVSVLQAVESNIHLGAPTIRSDRSVPLSRGALLRAAVECQWSVRRGSRLRSGRCSRDSQWKCPYINYEENSAANCGNGKTSYLFLRTNKGVNILYAQHVSSPRCLQYAIRCGHASEKIITRLR